MRPPEHARTIAAASLAAAASVAAAAQAWLDSTQLRRLQDLIDPLSPIEREQLLAEAADLIRRLSLPAAMPVRLDALAEIARGLTLGASASARVEQRDTRPDNRPDN
jgi:hypothetical protein